MKSVLLLVNEIDLTLVYQAGKKGISVMADIGLVFL
jgi:hypothetical protein